MLLAQRKHWDYDDPAVRDIPCICLSSDFDGAETSKNVGNWAHSRRTDRGQIHAVLLCAQMLFDAGKADVPCRAPILRIFLVNRPEPYA